MGFCVGSFSWLGGFFFEGGEGGGVIFLPVHQNELLQTNDSQLTNSLTSNTKRKYKFEKCVLCITDMPWGILTIYKAIKGGG